MTTSTFHNAVTFDLTEKACVILAEVEHPILLDLKPKQFEGIRTAVLNVASTTWTTRSGAIDCKNPKTSLITGLIRSIRQESTTSSQPGAGLFQTGRQSLDAHCWGVPGMLDMLHFKDDETWDAPLESVEGIWSQLHGGDGPDSAACNRH